MRFIPDRHTALNTLAVLAMILAPAMAFPSPLGGNTADAGWFSRGKARTCPGAARPVQASSCQVSPTTAFPPARAARPACTPYGCPAPVAAVRPVAVPASSPQAAAPAVAVIAPADTIDNSPLGALNEYRRRNGLHPLIYDPSMAADAMASNAAMRGRGLHHDYGAAPHQKCVGGPGSMGAIMSMWLADPPHARWLMGGDVRYGAVVHDGSYATFSAR